MSPGLCRTTFSTSHSMYVKKAITARSDEELVIERDGRWHVADPFFATWLRRAN
jgi:hypothetical protein